MTTKCVLCYGDSLSWGIIPGTRNRYPYEKRWPGILQRLLGPEVRVIEECLNGRTTAWDDPFRPKRNGREMLLPLLQSHSPLDLVILFLGTNDVQTVYGVGAYESSLGAAALVEIIQTSCPEPMTDSPTVLLVAPPPILQPCGTMEEKFRGAGEKSQGFAQWYRQAANQRGCLFFDSAEAIKRSPIDGVHLDEPQHQQFALAIHPLVTDVLGVQPSEMQGRTRHD